MSVFTAILNFAVSIVASSDSPEGPQKKKKKKSRWGAEEEKMIIPGVPAVLPANMNEDQQRIYLCKGSPLICIVELFNIL